MGGFFVNVFVRSDDQAAVVSAAKDALKGYYTPQELRSQPATAPVAYVAPAVNGWVGVYDSKLESQDEGLAEGIAMDLSDRLKTVAITFLVHDGDFLMYWLAVDGDIIDRFHSMPNYFNDELPADFDGESLYDAGDGQLVDFSGIFVTADEQEKLRGNPRLLAAACDKPEAEAALREVLSGPALDAYSLIARLSEILGIANADMGFDYLSNPPDWDGLMAANPALAPMAELQKQAQEQIVGRSQFVAITAGDLKA